jgi:hypothetical protein
MKVYCADTGWLGKVIKTYCAETRDSDKNTRSPKSDKIKIPKFNVLFSFYQTQNPDEYFKFAKNILVDSGAFTLQQKKITVHDARKYFKSYCKFIEENHKNPIIQGFFELDIPEQVGYEQVKEYRDELFEITDKIIPVWHKEYGVREYKKLSYDYDYISVSCVNHRSIKKESYPKFVKYAHHNNCKIHGLGLLQEKILDKVPFDSVDGTSWFKMARYGKKNGKKINSDYIYKNQYELTFIELMEHIRFQEKMHKKWQRYHND